MDRLRPRISGLLLGHSCIEKETGGGALNSWMAQVGFMELREGTDRGPGLGAVTTTAVSS